MGIMEAIPWRWVLAAFAASMAVSIYMVSLLERLQATARYLSRPDLKGGKKMEKEGGKDIVNVAGMPSPCALAAFVHDPKNTDPQNTDCL